MVIDHITLGQAVERITNIIGEMGYDSVDIAMSLNMSSLLSLGGYQVQLCYYGNIPGYQIEWGIAIYEGEMSSLVDRFNVSK